MVKHSLGVTLTYMCYRMTKGDLSPSVVESKLSSCFTSLDFFRTAFQRDIAWSLLWYGPKQPVPTAKCIFKQVDLYQLLELLKRWLVFDIWILTGPARWSGRFDFWRECLEPQNLNAQRWDFGHNTSRLLKSCSTWALLRGLQPLLYF